MSKGARVFGCICFFGFLVPYTVAALYLTVIQEPNFVCGFKLFWDGRNSCIHEIRQVK